MHTPQSVPTRHDAYDAHLLRASIAGPQQEIIRLQLRERTNRYRNPWLVRFFRRPKVDTTTLTVDDFVADVRSKLEMAIRQRLQADPAPGVDADTVQRAPRVIDYLAYNAVQHSIGRHTEQLTVEEMKSCLRRDLRTIFPQGSGVFIAESPAHPLWPHGRERLMEDDTVVHEARRQPTTFERKLALYLAGPHCNLSGPDGRAGEILEAAQPFLLQEDTGDMIQYAVELRQQLRGLLEEEASFDDALQKRLIDLIADEWYHILPSRVRDRLDDERDESYLPAADLIAKHFPPEVLGNLQAFNERRFLLEQHTIAAALESTEEDGEEKMEELQRVFAVWEEVMQRHSLAICDYPTLALAFLAGNVRHCSPETLLAQI